MEKIQAIGAPFDVQHSSCSNLKPKTFEWTKEDCPIKVFMDTEIYPGVKYEKKPGETKVAWVCESRTIFHGTSIPRDTWLNNIDKICENYDVVFTSEKAMLSQHPKLQFAYAGSNLPWIKQRKEDFDVEKSKICSIVASSKNYAYGHKLRHAIVEQFPDIVDVYGTINGGKRLQGVDLWDKSPGLQDYLFTFVIENDSYSTYYTEKLTDAFMTATIPIYWGAPDIGDIFDINGMIILTPDLDLNTLSFDLYESKMESVMNNYKKCIELEMADDYLYRKIKEIL